MFATRTRVLLILSQDTVDQARVLAGKAMTDLKMPVSLQIVLRALIEEGLKRQHAALFENIERQARVVRQIRSVARQRARAGNADGATGAEPGGRRAGRRQRQTRQPRRRGPS
jgi:hypothetical protein